MTRFLFAISIIIMYSCSDQKPDGDFNTKVDHPYINKRSIKVLYDEGHHNIHKLSRTYRPFRDVLENDGYHISAINSEFTQDVLKGANILVIVNPLGGSIDDKYKPAFNEAECSTLATWVHNGGSMLLVTDHYPIGSATEILARKFGVEMGKGTVVDSIPSHFDVQSGWKDQLVFTKANGLLMDNPITHGIEKVITFTGQSLSVPPGGQILLKLGDSSMETRPDSIWDKGNWPFRKTYTRFGDPVSTRGLCQGLALNFGSGKVIILGEAAMITAQVYETEKFGMNYGDNDNKQFLLNIMHWLTPKDHSQLSQKGNEE